MPLPTSKSALDRLGIRLAAAGPVSEEDLVELARIVDAYQDVLNGVKRQLTQLGFSATTRMKTTGTLVDKLRRETARLSQVQDLAGARIVVSDRMAQDETTKKICTAFESADYTYRIIDRRKHPSHGYRAVHVIAQVDKVPVEIQIRTDLQDIWAQLVERLADMWGRGIRYGEEPEAPDTQIGEGEQIGSRREMLSVLMELSDLIAKIEEHLEIHAERVQQLGHIAAAGSALAGAGSAAGELTIEGVFPQEWLSQLEQWLAAAQNTVVAALFVDWRHMTIVQFGEALRRTHEIASRDVDRQEEELRGLERDVRGILSRLAGAIGEG